MGSTAVGIQTKEGSVLAVEKRLTSPLLDPTSVEKIAENLGIENFSEFLNKKYNDETFSRQIYIILKRHIEKNFVIFAAKDDKRRRIEERLSKEKIKFSVILEYLHWDCTISVLGL